MKFLRVLVSAIAVCSMFFGVAFAKVVDKNVAMVNNDPIMLSEFQKVMDPVLEQYKYAVPESEQTPEKIKELKVKVLDQMIDEKLLKQEAEKRKIYVTKRDVEDGVAQVKKRFPTEAEFQSELKKENITIKEFENRIKEQIMVVKLTEQEIKTGAEKPADEDVKKFYEQVKAKMAGKILGLAKEEEEELDKLAKFFSKMSTEQIRARHILLMVDKDATMKDKAAALNKINAIKKKIDAGEDFAKLATENSQDTGSAKRGGDLGYFTKGDMVPEFEKTAFALKVGQVSKPVLTDFGYHIIKLEEIKAGKAVTFEDVKDDLTQYVYQKGAQKKYEKWLKSLRETSKITVNPIE